MEKAARRLLRRMLGRHHEPLTLPLRLASVGARPVDKLRLLVLGMLIPVFDRWSGFDRRVSVHANIHGTVVPLVLRDASDYWVLAEGRSRVMVPDFIDAPRTIIDCGAHIGAVSLQYRALFPDAAIYAVEPDPSTCAQLRHNVRGIPSITVVHAALSDSTGNSRFFQAAHSWCSSLTPPDGQVITETEVPTVTLSHLLEHYALDSVDLLKLDIEGAELIVLDDTEAMDRVAAVVGEIHWDLGNFTESELLARLRAFDAEITTWCPERALLVARRRPGTAVVH